MKVVLFCGGLGMRLREYSHTIPKPMVKIGYQPILWYVMKYYAHYGFTDFVICLGYRGDVIKDYFLQYNEALSNDFVLSKGGAQVDLINKDIQDWRITFVDTGQNTTIGQRLLRVRRYLDDGEGFLANYSDGLTDLPLDSYLKFARKHDKIGCFVAVRPTASFHAVESESSGLVTDIRPIARYARINCGYFAFKPAIFDYILDGEDLVVEPFQRLIKEKQLVSYEYDGFWECMDTFKDKQQLDDMYARGQRPWVVWNSGNSHV